MEKTFDDYLKASPLERRKMNMPEILGEERLAKTKEQMSLEEAAREYAEGPECTWVGTTALEEAFIAGAKWQRQQMMKDAVEGRVFMSFAPGHNQMVMADVDLPTNTKVRIVVLKEEE